MPSVFFELRKIEKIEKLVSMAKVYYLFLIRDYSNN